MKRLILTAMVLMGAISLAPMARSAETGKRLSPDAYQQIIKQQDEILKECEAFLDSLDKFVTANEDKETAQRVHDAIAYIKQAKVDDKMRLIKEFLNDEDWSNVLAASLNVDADFATFINMLSGQSVLPPEVLFRILQAQRDALVALGKEMKNASAKPYDDVANFGKAIAMANAILGEQRGLQGDLDKSGKPPEDIKNGEIKVETDTEKLRKMLESMGEPGASAAEALKNAQANMNDAAAAAGKMGGGNPQAKADAARAMQQAVNNLNKAIGEMGAAKNTAMDKVKKSYDFNTLRKRENEIADKLNDIRRKIADATGANSSASQALARAVTKSRSAARKAGNAAQDGGQNGSGGASGDQQAAQEDVDKAVAELERKMAQLEKIAALTNVENALEQMLKEQRDINNATAAADAERKAFEESNPGRQYAFSRATLFSIVRARNMQEDMAERVQVLEGILKDVHKIVFPRVFDDMHRDMAGVVGKLAVPDVGDETQYVEAHILMLLGWLKQAVHADLGSLKEQEKHDNGGGGGGKPGDQNQKKDPLLPSLAEIKMLRLMQMDVHLRTTELAKFHEGRIAAIDADTRLTPEVKAEMKKTADEQTRIIGMRLASEQSQIEAMVREIIETAQKSN